MTSIAEASAADIPLIHRMAWEVFPATYRDIISREQIEYMMDWMYSEENLARQMEDGHRYLLATVDGEAAGYVSFDKEGEGLYHLQKIYVLPAFQGRKLGRRLFDAAVKAIKESDPAASTLELNVNRNNPAVAFYKHLGMSVARSGDFPIGGGHYMNDYIMSMDI